MIDGLAHHLRRSMRGPLRFWHVHLILVSVLLLCVVAAGFYLAGRHSSIADTYRARVVLNEPHPPLAVRAAVLSLTPPAADRSSIHWWADEGPLDQGALGQCQCYAFRRQWDYLYRVRTGHPTRFSCAFWYPEATGGSDIGSMFDQYPPLLAQVGGIPTGQYDYTGRPAILTYPPPSWTFPLAAQHRYQLTSTLIAANAGAGQGAVNGVEWALGRHLPTNLGLPVYNSQSFFDWGAYTGNIDEGSESGGIAGYHAVTVVAYDRARTYNGVQGWFLIENQWGPNWGIARPGTTYPRGFAWVSFRTVADQGFLIEVAHLTSLLPGYRLKSRVPPPWFQPSPAVSARHLARPPHVRIRPSLRPGAIYTAHVYAKDTGQDLAPIVNAAAAHYGISPPGLLATIGAECGAYTTSPTCDRWGYWPDVSFGSCQVTVATAGQFGVGSGTSSSSYAVRGYEDNAFQCIWLAAKVLGDYKSYLGSVGCSTDFPNLYVAWNAGPGNPCWFIRNPSGQAGGNYYNNFLGWWNWALSKSVYVQPYHAPPPKKFVFPLASYNAYRIPHHLTLLQPYAHGTLRWQAQQWLTHRWLRGLKTDGRWFGKLGMMRYPYVAGTAYCWPRTRSCKVSHVHGK